MPEEGWGSSVFLTDSTLEGKASVETARISRVTINKILFFVFLLSVLYLTKSVDIVFFGS